MSLPPNLDHSTAKSYNLDMIQMMCRGNESQILSMISVFISQISTSINDIKIAYTENDFIQIKKLAHKIKPTLTYFGTAKLEKEFIDTELLISTETSSTELEVKIKNLQLLADEVVTELKNDFKITN
ncbi:hypothetical protein [Polaribacter sp.]|uniref:hypothetical protein n=1 Tax=Polaribacter sp. TaxID=1920175 RepID=UPI004047976C